MGDEAQADAEIYAHAPDLSLIALAKDALPLSNFFTVEKIAACQRFIEEARNNFFVISAADIECMRAIVENASFFTDYPGFYHKISQPLGNIKGQADAFGYLFISRLCEYLFEYCEALLSVPERNQKDLNTLIKLFEALQHAFDHKMVDTNHALELQLNITIELIRKIRR